LRSHHLIIDLLLGVFLLIPAGIYATNSSSINALDVQLKNLDNRLVNAQTHSLDIIEATAEGVSKRLRAQRKSLQNNPGFKENIDIAVSNPADIEKARSRLKRDIEEWTRLIEYTEIDELKSAIGDALAVARADGLDTDKLIHIYNLTKKIIRESSYRTAPKSVFDRVKNLDLDYAETDARLLELEGSWNALQEKIDAIDQSTGILPQEIWSREKLKAEQLAVEVETLQHRMGVRHEDISAPMYLVMDSILSGMVFLNSWTDEGKKRLKTSGLESHEFDSTALRSLAENYTLKILTLGFEGERLAKEAAEARQEVRKNFYKRSAVAFIRALVSGRDEIPECGVESRPVAMADHGGTQIRVLGCPDPVVENLKMYLDAFRKIRDAETERLLAEGEMLVAQQQIVVDFMAVVPLVGEALDVYSVIAGENLAGVKLSATEQGLIGVAVAIPIVGPQAFGAALKRYEGLQKKVDVLAEYFLAVARTASEISGSLSSMSKEATEKFMAVSARKVGVTVDELKLMTPFWKEAPYVLDDAARARMKLFKTMRDASEDRLVVSTLAGSDEFAHVFSRAKSESDRMLDSMILARQAAGKVESHMPIRHREAFLEVARKQRQAYAFRPVGRDAGKLLGDSFAGTKGLGIKPKSSNWGPHSAFIPVDQNFSKLGNPDFPINHADIAKFNAKAKACFEMNPPCAFRVPLEVKIPNEALPFEVVVVSKGGSNVPVYRTRAGEFVDPDTMKPFRAGEVDSSNWRPLEVFADADGNPLTADYDLLAVGSKRKAHSPGPGQGVGFDDNMSRQVPRGAGEQGTISDEIAEAVESLNEEARRAGYDKGKLVHHGPETFNPGTEGVFTTSEMNEGLSLTIIDPDHGELVIPACHEDCMKQWCRSSGMCNPDQICPKGVTRGCIPPDPDRLLKEYFHNARLRDIDFFPHSSWNWGNYNGLGGWTQTSFLQVPPEVAETASGTLLEVLSRGWQETFSSSLYRRLSAPTRTGMGEVQ